MTRQYWTDPMYLTRAINSQDTTIGLDKIAPQVGGILVIDRIDSNGMPTPSRTEYISYQGKTLLGITGVVRGIGGSTAQPHSNGAVVEVVPAYWLDIPKPERTLKDFLNDLL